MSVHVHVPVAAVASWVFTKDGLDFKQELLSRELRSSSEYQSLCLYLVLVFNLKTFKFLLLHLTSTRLFLAPSEERNDVDITTV